MPSEDKSTGSILTPSQREFLREQDDDARSEASARMTRKRIRNRLRLAPIDLATILRTLPDKDLDKAFLEPVYTEYMRHDPKKNISDALGVLYLGSVATKDGQGIRGLDSVRTTQTFKQSPLIRTQSFENRAAKGIKNALVRRGLDVNNVSVSVELEVEGELTSAKRDLSEIPSTDMEQLRLAGEISEKEYIREMNSRLDADDESPR